jgi:homospermidine synthase
VAKIMFIPFSVAGGLLAGFLGKKLFDVAWGVVSDEEAPEPEHKRVQWGKLLLAAALQGAIFRATRTAADHGSRHAFETLTGTWPGEEAPEPE